MTENKVVHILKTVGVWDSVVHITCSPEFQSLQTLDGTSMNNIIKQNFDQNKSSLLAYMKTRIMIDQASHRLSIPGIEALRTLASRFAGGERKDGSKS